MVALLSHTMEKSMNNVTGCSRGAILVPRSVCGRARARGAPNERWPNGRAVRDGLVHVALLDGIESKLAIVPMIER